MTFFRKILNSIETADVFSIESVRIAAIVFGVFVFGIALRSAMFSPGANADALATPQPVAVTQAVVPLVRDADSVVRVEEADAQSIEESEGFDADADLMEKEGGHVASSTVVIEDQMEDVATLPLYEEEQGSAELSLVADAYIVARGTMPVETMHERNSGKRRAPASLTKLMTAVVVAERIPRDEAVTITERAVATEGVAGRVRAGERFAAEDLMKMMLIVSSNDAAAAFADHFIEKGDDLVARMNEKAREIGMNDTHFANASGLDAEDHYSTAFDLALLASYSLRHESIWEMLSEKADTVYSVDEKVPHQLLSNNPITHRGMNGVKGSKTGFTDLAGGCMITVLDGGTVVVVLGSKDRAGDTETLIRAVQN